MDWRRKTDGNALKFLIRKYHRKTDWIKKGNGKGENGVRQRRHRVIEIKIKLGK